MTGKGLRIDYTSEGNGPSFLTFCIPILYCQLEKNNNNNMDFTLCEVGSAMLSAIVPEAVVLVLCPPGLWPGLNFEREIMMPSLASEASLVRMRSRELSLRSSDGIHEARHEGRGKVWTDIAKNAQIYTRTRTKKAGA